MQFVTKAEVTRYAKIIAWTALQGKRPSRCGIVTIP
jgi:hypothetical protein